MRTLATRYFDFNNFLKNLLKTLTGEYYKNNPVAYKSQMSAFEMVLTEKVIKPMEKMTKIMMLLAKNYEHQYREIVLVVAGIKNNKPGVMNSNYILVLR
jgi:hypothetical protein